MKKAIFILVLIIIFSRLAFANNINVRELSVFEGSEYVKGEIIVKFKNDVDHNEIKRIFRSLGTSEISRNRYSNTRRVRVRESNEKRTIEDLREDPSVEYATLNYICKPHGVPNDPLFKYQWNLSQIGMENAWNAQAGSDKIIVAVLDTGICYEDYDKYPKVPDLDGTQFCHPYDFVNDDYHANDTDGHGTHVTGTICQTTNNNYGVAGMAYGVSIMPVKVMGSGGGTALQLMEGLYWAVNHGANVINMSLGFQTSVNKKDVPFIYEAIKYAYSKNVVLVSSSGNDGSGTVTCPASYEEVISVGAIHSGGLKTAYSQYGEDLELVAPGGDTLDRDGDGYVDGVLQQTINNLTFETGFYFYIGTSMASPHVAGLVALLLSQNPDRNISDIRHILHTTAVDLGDDGWDEFYGFGRIDAYSALGCGYIRKDKHSNGCFILNLI